MQRVSPKQSFTGANLTQTHTALSLLAAQSIETRDQDETALAVLARVFGVSHRSKRGDFVN